MNKDDKNTITYIDNSENDFENNLNPVTESSKLPLFITPEENHIQIKKLKILIVEDDESSAMLLTEIVKKYCKETLYATTGVEAVEAYCLNPDIDLILMDIHMPVMNGREATRQIRHYNKDIIIIAQSGLVFRSDRDKAIAAGCNEVISKPLNQNLLLDLIEKYFN